MISYLLLALIGIWLYFYLGKDDNDLEENLKEYQKNNGETDL
tara:strand:- start:1759 stop:1884 length:126 start_codon:yes stop_codon:yes gene_type:complete